MTPDYQNLYNAALDFLAGKCHLCTNGEVGCRLYAVNREECKKVIALTLEEWAERRKVNEARTNDDSGVSGGIGKTPKKQNE